MQPKSLITRDLYVNYYLIRPTLEKLKQEREKPKLVGWLKMDLASLRWSDQPAHLKMWAKPL